MAREAIAGVVRPMGVPTTPRWLTPHFPSLTKEGNFSRISRVK
jgi:hypothetical protein